MFSLCKVFFALGKILYYHRRCVFKLLSVWIAFLYTFQINSDKNKPHASHMTDKTLYILTFYVRYYLRELSVGKLQPSKQEYVEREYLKSASLTLTAAGEVTWKARSSSFISLSWLPMEKCSSALTAGSDGSCCSAVFNASNAWNTHTRSLSSKLVLNFFLLSFFICKSALRGRWDFSLRQKTAKLK